MAKSLVVNMALHAGCAQDAQFGCAVGVLFEEVVLRVERAFAECLEKEYALNGLVFFGSIQHEARALYGCGEGEVDDAAHRCAVRQLRSLRVAGRLRRRAG